MSRSRLRIEDILKLEEIILDPDDAISICKDEELRKELKNIIRRSSMNGCDELKDFLNNNKEDINVEKLVLAILLRHTQYIRSIQKEQKKKNTDNNLHTKYDVFLLEKEKKVLENSIKYIINSFRNINEVYLTFIEYDKVKGNYYVEVFNSDELIKNSKEKEKNRKRFISLNEKYKDKYGIDNMFSIFTLGDIPHLFDDKILGNSIMLTTEANIASKLEDIDVDDIKSGKELHDRSKEILKRHEQSDETDEVIKEEILRYSKYINIDNFLLIFEYRVKERLEKEEVDNPEECEELLKEIYKDVQKNSQISYVSEFYVKNGSEKEEIRNSPSEIKETINRFIDGEYIKNTQLNEQRKEILNGNLNLSTINPSLLELINLSEYEVEQVMTYNLDNFIYGSKLLNYDLNKIINKLNACEEISKNTAIKRLYDEQRISIQDMIYLYENGEIDKLFFSQYSKEIDFSNDINIDKINEKYKKIKSNKKASENDKKELDAIIDLYRTINIDEKSEEEKDKSSDEIMYEIFEDEELLMFYYDNGLITLNVLAEWTGEEYVEELLNTNKISLSDIESLYKKEKVSREFLENSILNSELDDDKIVLYMREGYIKEDNIIKIFEERNIYSNEPQNLLELGRISQTTYEILVERSIEKLEERTGQSLEELEDIDEIDDEIYLPYVETKSDLRGKKRKHKINKPVKKRSQKLIKKEARKKLLALLGCKIPRVVKYDVMGNRNPLYNYNFYILQKDYMKEKVQRDDIVIAERLHEDRENKSGDAIDNATYVMKYEDYLILQGKQLDKNRCKKREMIKEVDGAVYVVNHRSGTWAKNLLKAITQVDMGQSLNNISQRNTRKKITEWLENTYYDEHILRILDLAARMDKYEEFTYIQKDGKLIKLNNNSDQNQIKPDGNSTDDDTDGR